MGLVSVTSRFGQGVVAVARADPMPMLWGSMTERLQFPPGTVVGRPKGRLVTHIGVATDRTVDGWQTVVAACRRRGAVVEQTLPEFARGRQVRDRGYPGTLSPGEVVRRARTLVGRPYRLFGRNCEHVVMLAHGLTPRSRQLRLWSGIVGLALGGITVACAAAVRSRRA